MTHGSLFSGIGGFDLAAEWMGWENVFHCEWNEFGQKVLKHYWPKSISYADICATDFSIHRGNIDILTGGFPCQPYSTAGKRLGKEDDRHLWPEMLRAIQEIQPKWIVGENVLGLVNWNGGLVFHEVQTDLEAQGYEVQPFVLPAVSVNAPHRRDRVWFVAYAISNGRQKHSGSMECKSRTEKGGGHKFTIRSNDNGTDGDAADTNGVRLEQRKNSGEMGVRQTKICRAGGEFADATQTDGAFPDAPDTGNKRLQGDEFNGAFEAGKWKQGFSHSTTSELHKISNWEQFPTESPICVRDDGISDRLDSITFPKWRNESIKAAGNAIVPQVVYQIFKAIEQYEQLNTTTT